MNTQQLIKTFQAALASLVLFGGVTSTSIASTPDGETPANEGVCDILQGASPGLYGLCVAYCEAQDLDLVGDKETPNNRILANYRKKMKAGDPDMPCLQVPCPCWTADQLANVGATVTPVCTVNATFAQARVLTSTVNQQASSDLTRNICRFTDSTALPSPISLRFNISAEEAASCYSQVVDRCTALGQ